MQDSERARALDQARETALRTDATYLSPSGRIVRVQGHKLTGRILLDSRGRVAVRNIDTDRLSYVHQADLRELAIDPPPSGASPQAETSEDEDDAPAVDSWSAPLRKPVVPKILSTDDFYALLRILEVLPIADPFLTDLQSKLLDEHRRQHGNRASHLSGPEFVREIERIEALIQSRLPAPVSPVEPELPTNPPCARCGHALSAHRPEFGACDGRDRPCACPEYQVPTAVEAERAKACHLCGAPMKVEKP